MPLRITPLVAHSVIAPQLLASTRRQLPADGPIHEQLLVTANLSATSRPSPHDTASSGRGGRAAPTDGQAAM
ncbi:hypothetical protein [Micromonospora zamorensis]|uniref:hypothetical protein n=1 Tax=Micromonospora zamorensis TaxID=709883 RepID=UPI0033B76906